MKLIIYISLIFSVVSCTNDTETFYSVSDIVEITQLNIPDTVRNQDSVQISGTAIASDNCWRTVFFKLNKYDNFEFTLKAYALADNDGTCPMVTIREDTVIYINTTKKGKYIFYVTRKLPDMEVDTMVVE